jgi:CBS domain-containing protein
MTTDVVTVAPELSLRDGMELFTRLHISGAPVMARGKVVGVVSLTDLAELASESPGVPTQRAGMADWGDLDDVEVDEDLPPGAYFADLWDDAGANAAERIDTPATPEWNSLEELTIGEAMSRSVADLPSDTPVDEAAGFMQRLGIHRVLVMDDGRLVGVVSTKDISDAVAEHQLTRNVYVFGAPATKRGGS